VTFPAGYQVPPGEKVELSLKSSHPQYSVIKVPVYQAQAPVARPAPPVFGPQLPANRPVTNAFAVPKPK
jgi:hypothetical protein